MTAQDVRVAEILSSIADSGSLAERFSSLCLAELPITGVAVALTTTDAPGGVVLAATDSAARELEELQFSLGEGPCVEAAEHGRPALHPNLDTSTATRWPRYQAAALRIGIRAVFAFPLRVGAIRVGVLDLYRDSPGSLSSTDLANALAFADAATVLVLHLQDDDEPLAGPIDSRAVVHQATGMITIQLGVGLAEALLRLRARAYAENRTVSDVATDVVDRRIRFGDPESDPSADDRRKP